jgi:hypothetical protein
MSIRSILSAVAVKETGWIVETRPSVASGDGFYAAGGASQATLSSGDLITYTGAHRNYYILTRFDYYGGIVFSKAIELGNYRMFSGKVAVDANDNIYTVGTIEYPASSGLRDISLRKYTSSGALLWEKLIHSVDNDGESGFKIINGYIYILYIATVYSLLKLDLDGNFQLIKTFTLHGGSGYPRAFHVNANNVLLIGYSINNPSYSVDNIGWVTFNLNNNSLLTTIRYASSATMKIPQVYIDNSSNVYIATKIRNATILKYNSNGTLLWKKGFIQQQTSEARDMSITSSHVYVSGSSLSDSTNVGCDVCKYTLAGVFVSRLQFSPNSDYTYSPVINVFESGVMYASCISNAYQCVVKGTMGNALFTGGGTLFPWPVGVSSSAEGASTTQAPTVSYPTTFTMVAGTAPTITTTTALSMVDMIMQKWTKILY